MRAICFTVLAALCLPVFAAQVPRKAPDIQVMLPNGQQATSAEFHGDVLCVAFILTT